MLEEGKISSSQLMLLVITIIMASAILLLPALPTKEALQDSWLSSIIAVLAGIIAAFLVLTLAQRFPGQSLVEYSVSILGTPLGKIVGFLYFLFFLHLTSILAREISATIVASILQRTPIEVLIITAFVAIVFLARKGLETIARTNLIILFIAMTSVILIYFLIIGEFNIENLTPVLEKGMLPVLKGAITPIGWFGEVVSIGFLLPYMNKLSQAPKATYLGIAISGGIFIFILVGTVAVFGPDATMKFTFPTLSVARQVRLANFIERIESLLVGGWIVWNFVKTTIFFYITVLILSQLLKLKDYRPIVFPMGILATVLAVTIFNSQTQLADFLALVWGKYAGIFEFLIPIILLLTAIIRGKKVVANGKK